MDNLKFVDMHFHSCYSDGTAKIQDVVKRCKKNKIGVAITDHNEIEGALKLAKVKGVFSIPGIELSGNDLLDLLLFFYNPNELKEFYEKHIKKNRGEYKLSNLNLYVDELIEISKKYNCIKCIPHSFSPKRRLGIKIKKGNLKIKKGYGNYIKIIKDIDAIEVINGHLRRKRNANAMLLAKKLDKAYTGGSDSHTIYNLGRVLTIAEANDREEFLNEILKKRNSVFSYKINTGRLFLSKYSAFKNYAKHPLIYMKEQIKKRPYIKEIWK